MRSTGGRVIARPPMAHLPEPRWRWWAGALAEMAVLLFAVAVVLVIAGLNS